VEVHIASLNIFATLVTGKKARRIFVTNTLKRAFVSLEIKKTDFTYRKG